MGFDRAEEEIQLSVLQRGVAAYLKMIAFYKFDHSSTAETRPFIMPLLPPWLPEHPVWQRYPQRSVRTAASAPHI